MIFFCCKVENPSHIISLILLLVAEAHFLSLFGDEKRCHLKLNIITVSFSISCTNTKLRKGNFYLNELNY